MNVKKERILLNRRVREGGRLRGEVEEGKVDKCLLR